MSSDPDDRPLGTHRAARATAHSARGDEFTNKVAEEREAEQVRLEEEGIQRAGLRANDEDGGSGGTRPEEELLRFDDQDDGW